MTAQAPDRLATCVCGSTWFQLVAFVSQDGSKGLGGVNVNTDGYVVAYSGVFECIECLTRLVFHPSGVGQVPARAALQLLKQEIQLDREPLEEVGLSP